MVSLWQRIFPVPHMLTMDAGGIEISEHSVKYFRFEYRHGRREIAGFGAVELPEGAVKDGEIGDSAALVRVLAVVRARCGFSFVHASLSEQKGYLFNVAMPRDASPLSDSVALALPEHVPLSPAEAVFDCETVRAESNESARSVVVTVFPETVAQAYVDALSAGGFFPLSLELEPQAAARAIMDHAAAHTAYLLIDFGANKTVLSVFQNGSVRFTTSSDGSAAADDALARAGTHAESKPASGTKGAKNAQSANTAAPALDADAIARVKSEEGLSAGTATADLLMPAAAALAASVKRVLVYWQSRAPQNEQREKIAAAIVYGGNANIRGLTEYLSAAAGIACEVADLRMALGGDARVPPLPKDRSLRYATTIGLALRANGPES